MDEGANTAKSIRAAYDTASLHYRADNAQPPEYARWIGQLSAALERGSRILDVGCGCGIPVARDLTAAGYVVTGIDISGVQVERARRLVPAAKFVRADVTVHRFRASSFDAVVALYSFIHMPLSAQPGLLESIRRWLVPDGLLLLTAGWEAWTGAEDDWLGSGATMWWSQADVTTYRQWLHQAGFDISDETFVPEGNGGHSLFWARVRDAEQ
ncbi:MAG: class I SAM-dependent methyltransferase [Streptosporangiales bacterium]